MAEILHRMAPSVQNFGTFAPRHRAETASEESKKGVFRAKIAPQDELSYCGDFEHYFEGHPRVSHQRRMQQHQMGESTISVSWSFGSTIGDNHKYHKGANTNRLLQQRSGKPLC